MAAVMEEKRAYTRLTKRFPLRPIRTDEKNVQAGDICDRLTDRIEQLNSAERDYLEVLGDLIAKYESRWSEEFTKMSPRRLIEYLMEQNGLSQKDLVSEFGGASRVSEFLNGERKALSLNQAKKLAKRFSIGLAALIR